MRLAFVRATSIGGPSMPMDVSGSFCWSSPSCLFVAGARVARSVGRGDGFGSCRRCRLASSRSFWSPRCPKAPVASAVGVSRSSPLCPGICQLHAPLAGARRRSARLHDRGGPGSHHGPELGHGQEHHQEPVGKGLWPPAAQGLATALDRRDLPGSAQMVLDARHRPGHGTHRLGGPRARSRGSAGLLAGAALQPGQNQSRGNGHERRLLGRRGRESARRGDCIRPVPHQPVGQPEARRSAPRVGPRGYRFDEADRQGRPLPVADAPGQYRGGEIAPAG